MPSRRRLRPSAKIVHLARQYRREPTPAEEMLWKALRDRRLEGLKFRRQHPLGRYILDAYCVSEGLVVEVDGAVHQETDQAAHDAEREVFLASQGIRVLRFTNDEVENRMEEVVRKIMEAAGG